MTFDRSHVEAEVQRILSSSSLPGTTKDLVAAGVVSRVIARDGRISVILDLPAELPGSREEFKSRLQETLGAIAGVQEAQVLEKSQPSAAPAGAAPAAAPVMPQGSANIPGVRHLVAVASGKGGVGKSTVAVNLATELARQGRRVGLLDSDVYGPSIPKMLGIEGAKPRATEDEMLLPLEAHGIKTMSIGFMLDEDSPVIWRGPMVTSLLKQFLNQVQWGELDELVLDLPPGTGDAQLTLVQSIALTCGIIVTTPQDVALLDVRRGIQMFQRVEVPIFGVVENMSHFECPACGVVTDVFSSGGGERAAKDYDVPFLGSIPLRADYALSGDRGIPTVISEPKSSLATVIQSMARSFIESHP